MFSEYIMRIIRQRLDLDEDDTSQDDSISNMSPYEAFQEVCGWKLGDPFWAPDILMWVEGCGYELTITRNNKKAHKEEENA